MIHNTFNMFSITWITTFIYLFTNFSKQSIFDLFIIQSDWRFNIYIRFNEHVIFIKIIKFFEFCIRNCTQKLENCVYLFIFCVIVTNSRIYFFVIEILVFFDSCIRNRMQTFKKCIFFIFTFAKFTIFANFAFFVFESSFVFIFAIIFEFEFLFFSFVFCDHVFENHFMTQNFKTLYNMHLIENVKILRYNWFIQIKKTQKTYHLRKHELQMKNKIKQKTKKLLKQQKEIRLIKKRIEKYTCKRCKHSIKFDNNIKFHEHICNRHAKKSKQSVQQFVEFVVLFFIFFVSSFESIIFSSFSSSKFLFFSMFALKVVRERSKNVSSKLIIELSIISSKFLSNATSKKSIFWTKIISRFVASKFSRFSIATFKSICKSLKNTNIVCSFISFRTFTSRFYFIVNDLCYDTKSN